MIIIYALAVFGAFVILRWSRQEWKRCRPSPWFKPIGGPRSIHG